MGGWFPSEASQPELYQSTQSCVWGCGVGEWGVKQRGGGDLNSVSLRNTHTHVPEMILRLWAVLHSYAKSPRDLTSASTCGRRWSSRAQLTLHYGSHPLMSADADIKNKVGVTAFKWAPGDLRFQLDRLFQQSALLWHKCMEWGNNLFTTSYEITFGRCLKEM